MTVGDTSWQRLAPVRAEDIPSYHGEILSEAREKGIDLHRFAALAATTENEAYNALVCSELAPELGRDNVHQLGDAGGDEPAALPAALRGRAVFRSGLGVEEAAAREDAGWSFGALTIEHGTDAAAATTVLPDDGDPLLLIRRSGALRFFTHASNLTAAAGDTILAYAPPDALTDAGWRLLDRAPLPQEFAA